VLLAVNVVLLNLKIITIEESLQGMNSPSVLSIGILFVVARAMEETGVIETALINMLGNPSQVPMAVLRLGLPVAILSAFMNNTPIVAMMIPIVQLWSERTGISASKLLMPLSFAAMLGGMCTLLGTSTNLILQVICSDNILSIVSFHNFTKNSPPTTLLSH
jgi:Na+/H+ antiporter NhaD/arsenite permease-like protein